MRTISPSTRSLTSHSTTAARLLACSPRSACAVAARSNCTHWHITSLATRSSETERSTTQKCTTSSSRFISSGCRSTSVGCKEIMVCRKRRQAAAVNSGDAASTFFTSSANSCRLTESDCWWTREWIASVSSRLDALSLVMHGSLSARFRNATTASSCASTVARLIAQVRSRLRHSTALWLTRGTEEVSARSRHSIVVLKGSWNSACVAASASPHRPSWLFCQPSSWCFAARSISHCADQDPDPSSSSFEPSACSLPA